MSRAVALRLLVLRTPQLHELGRFYQTLGLEFTEEQHGSGPVHLAGALGDAVFELYPALNPSADLNLRLGFTVPNLAEVVQTLRTLGTPLVQEPRATVWGLRAIVRDPDGRTVELYQA